MQVNARFQVTSEVNYTKIKLFIPAKLEIKILVYFNDIKTKFNFFYNYYIITTKLYCISNTNIKYLFKKSKIWLKFGGCAGIKKIESFLYLLLLHCLAVLLYL